VPLLSLPAAQPCASRTANPIIAREHLREPP
jgi:hypothetical protein